MTRRVRGQNRALGRAVPRRAGRTKAKTDRRHGLSRLGCRGDGGLPAPSTRREGPRAALCLTPLFPELMKGKLNLVYEAALMADANGSRSQLPADDVTVNTERGSVSRPLGSGSRADRIRGAAN
ncbi:hypothetical protein SKAU_G00368100 [Synaphobranchus kaupii]|uniref:Uncharacterized protein n=1 Tax=Synaphobranchus kaupii TaxID=118154 RepID=A0A9Q1IFM0_SYNKA|nr:hypothetical protein SKAU_G00368100 [Synaphobranchus kaupii]